MPARLAARFECDDVLMPQLVDDLPGRSAALSRRACHEDVATGPAGQIGERTGAFSIPSDQPPTSVVIDPGVWALMDVAFSKR